VPGSLILGRPRAAPGGLVSAPAAPGQAFSNHGPWGPGRPGAGPGYPAGFSEIADVSSSLSSLVVYLISFLLVLTLIKIPSLS